MLEVTELRKFYGGIRAVDGCSFDVEQGSITGLIGPNGAGKTTLFDLVTGREKPDSGHVILDGEEITGHPPHEIVRRGLYRGFQIPREIHELTLMENLLLIPDHQAGEKLWNTWMRRGFVREQENEHRERAREILRLVELYDHRDSTADALSGGQRKLLDLARMLMTEPRIALLDEPGSGLPPSLQETMIDRIHNIRDERNVTFLVIEHAMNVIMNLCDSILVMVDGSVLTRGSPEEVRTDPRVIEAYLGSETSSSP